MKPLLSDPSLWVSICALATSLFSCWAKLRHNKKAVRPKLDMMESYTEDGLNFTIKSFIRNSGLGPAIFETGTITFRGKTYQCSNESDIEKLIVEAIPQGIPHTINRHETREPGFMMIPQEQYCIVEVTLHGPNEETLQAIREAKKEMGISISYKSLYDEVFYLRK